MREQIQKPESTSRTIQSKSNASNQASIAEVLQTYKKGIYQRQSADEEEDLIQGKFETAQRESLDEEEETLQGKFEVAQREEAPNNTGLPDNLKSGIENASGYSMDDVRVHYNSSKPAQLQALAYTQGTDIHVAPGQEQHLAHEAWHVVQQKQGRVQPTMQMQGVNVNDNEGLEKEADVMGGKMKETCLSNYFISKDTKNVSNDLIQCYMGSRRGDDNHVCACESLVHYKEGGRGIKTNRGNGGNDRSTIGDVLKIFMLHGLYNLVNIEEKDNPPGGCAEPHSLADALNGIPKNAKILDVEISQSEDVRGNLKRRCKTCKGWIPGNKVSKDFLVKKQ